MVQRADDHRLALSTAARVRAAACLAACLAGLLLAGCEVRDEPVKPPDRQAFWAGAARPQSGDSAGREANGVAYVDDYAAAARRAGAEGRPLLIVFRASWCRWSAELARGPLADPRLVALTRRCVCTQVDADRDAATCRTFAVAAFPTVIVVGADGHECFRGAGMSATAGLAAALDAVPPAGAAEERLAAEERKAGAVKDVTR